MQTNVERACDILNGVEGDAGGAVRVLFDWELSAYRV